MSTPPVHPSGQGEVPRSNHANTIHQAAAAAAKRTIAVRGGEWSHRVILVVQ